MEIIHICDGRYDEYEELLLERDRYRKEAELYLKAYIHEFGERITAVFKQKITCIEKKKMLSYCLMYFNRGESVDMKTVTEQVKTDMAEYQKQLDSMIAENEICKHLSQLPEADVLKIRQIYRKIARKLHPDLNPLTERHEALMELWLRNLTAYQCNDLKELEEVEVLVEQALAALGEGKAEIYIPDIAEKIQKLKEEIETIRNTDPYLYKFLLCNPGLVQEKNNELDNELNEYTEYARQLDEQLKNFVLEGGTFSWEN